MKVTSLFAALCLVLAACVPALPPTEAAPQAPPATATPTLTAAPTPPVTAIPGEPFSKSHALAIPSIPAVVGKAEAFFVYSGPTHITANVNGMPPKLGDKYCVLCVATIKIGPKLVIPLAPFTPEKVSQGYTTTVIQYPDTLIVSVSWSAPNTSATGFIISGIDGATLQKVDAGFVLVEGEASYVSSSTLP